MIDDPAVRCSSRIRPYRRQRDQARRSTRIEPGEPSSRPRVTSATSDRIRAGRADGSVEVKALSGFWVTFGQLLVYNLYRGHRGPMRLFPVIPALGMIIQILALGLDSLDRSEEWTWAYLAVGKRGGS